MNVNLKEISEYVAANNFVSKKAALVMLEDAFEYIANAVKTGDTVLIADFGKLAAETKPARTARNPKTGESIQVPEKRVVKFKPLKKLRDELNEAE